MATWIWPKDCGTTNAYAQFQAVFSLASLDAVEAKVSVSGDYVLWINGKAAGFGQYNDWPEIRSINTHEIANLCVEGENELLLEAWHPNLDCSVDTAGPARIWFEVVQNGRCLAESSLRTPCRCDVRYLQGPMWMITGQQGYSFEYDACQELPAWGEAQEAAAPKVLKPRPIAQLVLGQCKTGELRAQGVYFGEKKPAEAYADQMRRAALSMRFIEEIQADDGWYEADCGDGLYLLYDMGEESSGFLTLDADFEEDTEVLIGYGEHLKDLRVRTEIDTRHFCVRYCAKAGHNHFTHWFRRLGGRYFQVHVAARRVRIHNVSLLSVDYPSDHRPTFRCNDLLHNRIFEVGKHTLDLCMHSHYEDTPWREQALYGMDSRIQMLCGYYAFGETDMPRESMRLLAGGMREDGILELCAPAKIPITIPSFSLAFVMALWDYALYSGDQAFAEEMKPTVMTILDAFAKRSDDQGRLSCFREKQYWNFFEWQPGLDGGDLMPEGDHPLRYEGLLTAYYALALDAAENLYHCGLQERICHAVNGVNAFWNEEKGLYAAYIENERQDVYAALMQSLALLCGAATGERAVKLRSRLADGAGLIEVTLSDSLMRYQALMQDEETYADFVFNEIGDIWGKMLYENATSFWETALGEKDFHNAGSHCHGWAAVPVYMYFAYALGARPTTPGVMTIHQTMQTVLAKPRGLMKTTKGWTEFK